MLMMMLFSSIMILMLLTLTILMNINKWHMKKLPSTFECGFNNLINSHQKFSTQFFFICILFLIFDIEMILIIPSPLSNKSNFKIFTLLMLIVIILTIGLIEEWKKGILEWTK